MGGGSKGLTAFRKELIGYDRLEVNIFIYDSETNFLSVIEEIDDEIQHLNKKTEDKNKRIEELIKKCSALEDSTVGLHSIDGIIEQIKEKFLLDAENRAKDILSFYEKENNKLEANIEKLDKEIEDAKATLHHFLSSVYSSLDNSATIDMKRPIEEIKGEDVSFSNDSIIGKTVTKSLTDASGNIIVKNGDTIDEGVLQVIKKSNKIMELISNLY